MKRSQIRFGVDIWENRSFERFIRSALTAEKLGFDSVWAAEVHELDLLVKLTVAAVRTRRVKIGSIVLVPGIRNPVVLAKTLSSLDVLCKGRLIVGVGTGGGPEGFERMRISSRKPATRMLETIHVMKRLWTERSVSFDGEFYHLENCRSPLSPFQQPHPPIWIGANGPRMLEITAKLGDGWFGDVLADEYPATLTKIRCMAEEFGRNPDEITPARLEFTSIAEDHDIA
ncbi:MAG: LLM class flavin-dependent oxidoreductase [Candidatus Bathyarchaeota archaeon]|nr:LLM class flavin-dependent oxidoreductase [Candidatus Bathyarchaeota archaeon]